VDNQEKQQSTQLPVAFAPEHQLVQLDQIKDNLNDYNNKFIKNIHGNDDLHQFLALTKLQLGSTSILTFTGDICKHINLTFGTFHLASSPKVTSLSTTCIALQNINT